MILGTIASHGLGARLGSDMEWISTTSLATTASSVTFDVTGLGSTYKHLQLRIITGNNGGSGDYDNLQLRFNSDSSASYSQHRFYTGGTTIYSNYTTGQTSANAGFYNRGGAAYTQTIIDFNDCFNSTKYKTGTYITGSDTGGGFVGLGSLVWNSTTALTSIYLYCGSGSFYTNSQFSIYGIKGQ